MWNLPKSSVNFFSTMFKKRQTKAENPEITDSKPEKKTGEFSAFLDQIRQSRI
jgi:hypothetical protein